MSIFGGLISIPTHDYLMAVGLKGFSFASTDSNLFLPIEFQVLNMRHFQRCHSIGIYGTVALFEYMSTAHISLWCIIVLFT